MKRCCRPRRGLTLLEMLVVVSVTALSFLGYLAVVEKSMQATEWSREALSGLVWAENELEWWSAAPKTQRQQLTPGNHPFANPTAHQIVSPWSAVLTVEPLEGDLVRVQARVKKANALKPLDITLETILSREEATSQ